MGATSNGREGKGTGRSTCLPRPFDNPGYGDGMGGGYGARGDGGEEGGRDGWRGRDWWVGGPPL